MTTTVEPADAGLGEALAILRAVDAATLPSLAPEAIELALAQLEEACRLTHSLACMVTAEAARRARRDGRSTGSTAKELGGRLRVPESQIHDRIAAGARAGSAGFEAFSRGRITAQQEKKIAESLDQVPDGIDDEVRRRFEADLLARAEDGMGPWQLARQAEKILIRLDAGRLDRKFARQNKNRHAVFSAPSADGTFTLSIRCTAEMKAMTDSLLARFARPGACLPVVPDPETGQVPDLDALTASDTRTPGQRNHDALAHALGLALNAGPQKPQGVASIVIRLTPEDMDFVLADNPGEQACTCEAGRDEDADCTCAHSRPGPSGSIVTTDAGSDLTARQAVAMAADRHWFVSALRDGREELHRITIDPHRPGRRDTLERLAQGRNGCRKTGAGAAATGAEAATGAPHPDSRTPLPTSTTDPNSDPGTQPRTRARGADSDPRPPLRTPARGGYSGANDPRGPRLATTIQRLVLYAAHGGCTHPGCSTPAAKCQTHHVVDYSQGGATVLANLGFGCPIHHAWVGDGPRQWQTIPDPTRPGDPIWIAPRDRQRITTDTESAA